MTTITNERLGIEINQLSEDRWLIRLTDLSRVPEGDWSNADWPGDDEISRAVGCPVRFAALGDNLDEAVYDAVYDIEPAD